MSGQLFRIFGVFAYWGLCAATLAAGASVIFNQVQCRDDALVLIKQDQQLRDELYLRRQAMLFTIMSATTTRGLNDMVRQAGDYSASAEFQKKSSADLRRMQFDLIRRTNDGASNDEDGYMPKLLRFDKTAYYDHVELIDFNTVPQDQFSSVQKWAREAYKQRTSIVAGKTQCDAVTVFRRMIFGHPSNIATSGFQLKG